MLVAQSLTEYASLSSFTAAIRSTASSVLEWFGDVSAQTWYMLGGMALLTLLLIKRRNRRRL